MAIVPPGNKQVETLQTEAVVSSGNSLTVTGAASYGVVKNLSINYTPIAPLGRGIDTLSMESVISFGYGLTLSGAALYGVVQYIPPRNVKLTGTILNTVVKNNSINIPPAPLENKGVDTISAEAVVNTPGYVIGLTGAILYGIVKFTAPRNEALIFSLYYGENNPYL